MLSCVYTKKDSPGQLRTVNSIPSFILVYSSNQILK
jgi:hypothetical protein